MVPPSRHSMLPPLLLLLLLTLSRSVSAALGSSAAGDAANCPATDEGACLYNSSPQLLFPRKEPICALAHNDNHMLRAAIRCTAAASSCARQSAISAATAATPHASHTHTHTRCAFATSTRAMSAASNNTAAAATAGESAPTTAEQPTTTTAANAAAAAATPLSLPAPGDENGGKQQLNVNGEALRLDHLGPMVVNRDGTLSRIANWEGMTELERTNTLRVLGKRNQLRLKALEQEDQEKGN